MTLVYNKYIMHIMSMFLFLLINEVVDMPKIEVVLNEGQIVNRAWLKEKGFSRSAIDYFLRSGKLKATYSGFYRKPGPPLKWQNIIYSFSFLGYHIHVGHLSALNYHGYQQFVDFKEKETILIYSDKKFPDWPNTIIKNGLIKQLSRNPFHDFYDGGLMDVPFGTWDWPIKYSTPERAFIEFLASLSMSEEIKVGLLMMESAFSFRPELVQDLLINCNQVKAKRLFFWMAKKNNHHWYKYIDQKKINLGSGKRQIIKGGTLDKDFLITVPKDGENVDESTFY